MNGYEINLKNTKKNITKSNLKLGGVNPNGDKISFTNYYMEKNGEPFFAICGEFHFSRYDERYWDDEIIKMKMGGINIIATYIFWIHHEEKQGIFDWNGNKNLRRFIELCAKHDMYVIVRIGPFDHGEVRNGGVPDWLFGRPFEIRSNDKEYLCYVNELYNEIGKQIKGLLYKDGGPIIGTQIENEYMHAASPWELTNGTSNQWMTGGIDGEAHMTQLKQMALNSGIDTPIYTCTGWGGAAAPTKEMLPLWGGYAFWPWIFYGDVKEHPATPEFIFRDYHNDEVPKCYNFEPKYKPESYPFACCEMGGGMTVFYQYRFVIPFASVDAMTGIKVAGGCNFIGYYMFHGGSNPKGKLNTYLNENATPKISYDFQAPLGEFGQVRESYKRTKLQHYFFKDFEKSLCKMKTIIPKGGSDIDPLDIDTLRYAVRINEQAGFLFINNYQDHIETKDQKNFFVKLNLKQGEIILPRKKDLSLSKDSSCILPFNLDMKGLKLKYSTTQLITKIDWEEEQYFFFFIPEGVVGEYCLLNDNIAEILVENGTYEKIAEEYMVYINVDCKSFIKIITKEGNTINICTVTREESLNFWSVDLMGCRRILITKANVLISEDKLRLECVDSKIVNLEIFPHLKKDILVAGGKSSRMESENVFEKYSIELNINKPKINVKRIKENKACFYFKKEDFQNVKELFLKVEYEGDIGYAFIDGDIINDNFCNGAPWEVGLMKFEKDLLEKGMYIYISPIKKGSFVKSDSTMAARVEVVGEEIAKIKSIAIVPMYEVVITI
ncbi:beta-galactosidase [Clostridium estertheticum]|uniref:Beta-galactosidase n=1 Tax=Clostridium estertheticum TaxID=238834 RepID=A0AA47ELF3_9CLOT|nr:beta-galactosidase [Clostridium estertheticum]MBU3155829.1 beta-galactosidase [Clostridium estertheticum]MBU3199208.1 beta-galactosidase [Clostridium estertheticum]WAG62357.1 beta-galactosidase [Clostridium estertheticum]WAG63536.1 beta-galactosidase [Clostridium estertheticum]